MSHPRLLLAALAVVVAVAATAIAIATRAPTLHAGVAPQRIGDPERHWLDRGFVEMVPPVRLPSDRAGRDHIRVWLKVGAGPITARRLADGRPTVQFPAGTIADRVESMGNAVIDVRGTTLTEAGELFHVYVAEDEAPSPLVGWEWRRGDFDAEASATRALLAQLEDTRRVLRGAPPPTEEQHANSLASYEKNNNCGGCHAHEKPQTVTGDTTHRPTDSSGFFVPLSVLAEWVPLERHRPWDMNVGDEFLTLQCASGATPRVVERGVGRLHACTGFEVPTGRLDVARAVAARDERALAMCASRRYLYEHMDESARALFSERFAECGIATLASAAVIGP